MKLKRKQPISQRCQKLILILLACKCPLCQINFYRPGMFRMVELVNGEPMEQPCSDPAKVLQENPNIQRAAQVSGIGDGIGRSTSYPCSDCALPWELAHVRSKETQS